jgi:alpha-glucosidase
MVSLPATHDRWWRDLVGYEIYVRSFSDSDGVGDLGELLTRLDYLVDLGTDLVWVTPFDWSDPRWAQWNAFEHHHDVCQPETLDIYRTWRELVAEYDAVVIGETYVLDDSQLAGMLTGDGLHFGFWFKPMFIECDAIRIRDVLRDPLASLPDASMIGWVSSGHDDAQPATRFGGGDTGRRRAPAFSTLLFCLPGPPFLYQGEELGLEDCAVPDDARADPVGADVELSRDGCRTPMIWEQGPSLGFSEADETWLPHIGRTDADTASVQVADPESWFHRYRALIDVRKSAPELRAGAVERLDENDGLVSFRRGGLHVALNAGDDSAALGVHGSVVFSTDRRAGVVGTSAVLDPGDAIVVRC